MKFTLFKKLIAEWLLFWLLAVAVFGGGRLVLFYRHTDEALRQQFAADLAPMWLKGLLFDIKMVSLTVAAFVLVALLALFSRKLTAAVYRANRYGLLAVLALFAALTVGNVFYYGVYDKPFDVFVFGLVEEDTAAVLKTVWSDFPVLRAVAALAAAMLVPAWLFGRLHERLKPSATPTLSPSYRTWAGNTLIVLLLLAALTAGGRGSFGKFPLRKSSAQVSPSATLNKLVLNPVTALSWAWSEYRAGSQFRPVGDEKGRELFSAMLGHAVAAPQWRELEAVTPDNPAAAAGRPNVVFALMESMSTHMMQLDNPQRDLLGRLRPHFAEDWVFYRFVSEGNGTSDSLHRLFVRSPLNNISQTAAKNKTFPGNMFEPYIKAGYRVVYITAGNGGWRDFDNFTKHLGVHEFVDETALKHRYPEAESGAWGVADGYMFRYAAERLEQAARDKQPVFIFMMSVTNHPPYHLPAGIQRQNFAFSQTELARFAQLGGEEQIREVFNTYRYANDELGAFISRAKAEGNTIIAASGDHNIRGVGYPDAGELALGHAVPLYLYAPPAYRGHTRYDPQRVGSHKDIMPTLYTLSLSQRPYFRTGCNLLGENPSDNPWCGYGYNSEATILPQGVIDPANGQFHPWQDEKKLLSAATAAPLPPEAAAVAERSKNYGAFLDWMINRVATEGKKQP